MFIRYYEGDFSSDKNYAARFLKLLNTFLSYIELQKVSLQFKEWNSIHKLKNKKKLILHKNEIFA